VIVSSRHASIDSIEREVIDVSDKMVTLDSFILVNSLLCVCGSFEIVLINSVVVTGELQCISKNNGVS
jgi:hypothetical protein